MNQLEAASHDFPTRLKERGMAQLKPLSLKTFQINVGKVCNQACHHCHVDASPIRTESMDRATIDKCLAVIAEVPDIEVVDITGGAPELNPHFRYLVEQSRALGKHVIDRCNLTVLEEPGQSDLGVFLARNQVEIIASLPHFAQSRTDAQRGRGVHTKSIRGLQFLNSLGYGDRLPLHLVYNPTGLFLSAPQQQLEREFKESLARRYGISFHNLYCINNMPISRFLDALLRSEKFHEFMDLLVNAFNPATIEGLMCRHQISVGYDGRLYDCDFNQMLELPAAIGHIDDFNYTAIQRREIALANHCFGCTAGAGSSCGGEIA
ncbi:MAG: arsenosugar biosynthesis radical SAM protein ArsS [Leptospiraceae bacterium]|nr:arsenosugar biosynthesis radical SAM protein ArsS [Leptospiraceae bacterium]